MKLFFCLEKEMEILSLLIKSVNDAESLESCLSFKQWLLWELNTQEDILMENERWNLNTIELYIYTRSILNAFCPGEKSLNIIYFLVDFLRSEYYNWIIYEHFMSLCKHGKDEFLEYEKMATEILSSILDHWTRFVLCKNMKFISESAGNRINLSILQLVFSTSFSVETDKVRSTITETNLIKILQVTVMQYLQSILHYQSCHYLP